MIARLSPRFVSNVAAMGGSWTPASLSGLAATLLPALSRSSGLLWQNTAKTTAATADGDPVRVAICPYTGVEFTAPSDATRPLLYDEGGDKWALAFDGVDDELTCPATFAADFEWMGRVRWTGTVSVVNNRHVLSTNSQNPTIKQYAESTFADGDFRVFNGATLYRCVGSFPGFGATGWRTVGLSRASDSLFARAGATDFTAGITTTASLATPAVMGRPGVEKAVGRLTGLVTTTGRLSADARTLLADYLSTLSA